MGTWDTTIFGDDLAVEVRAAYEELLSKDTAPTDIMEMLQRQFAESIDDEDEGPVFWLALAATQLKYAHLEDLIRDRALHIIATGVGLDRWAEDPVLLAERKEVLKDFTEKLQKSTDSSQALSPVNWPPADWEPGEIVGYRLKSGNLALLRMCGYEKQHGATDAVFELLEFLGSEFPDLQTLESLSLQAMLADKCGNEPPLGKNGMRILKAAGKLPLRMSYKEYCWQFKRQRFVLYFLRDKPFDVSRVHRSGAVTALPKNRLEKTGANLCWNLLDDQLDEYFGLG